MTNKIIGQIKSKSPFLFGKLSTGGSSVHSKFVIESSEQLGAHVGSLITLTEAELTLPVPKYENPFHSVLVSFVAQFKCRMWILHCRFSVYEMFTAYSRVF